jgi:hypothetical protein
MNQKNFDVAIKNQKYNEIDKFHYYTRVHPSLFYKMKELNDKNRLYHRKFKQAIHDLVRIRNKIFKLQEEWKANDNPDEIGLTSENIVKFMEYTKAYEQTPEHDIFNSWDITKRNTSKLMFNEIDSVAMTDSDQENESGIGAL